MKEHFRLSCHKHCTQTIQPHYQNRRRNYLPDSIVRLTNWTRLVHMRVRRESVGQKRQNHNLVFIHTYESRF